MSYQDEINTRLLQLQAEKDELLRGAKARGIEITDPTATIEDGYAFEDEYDESLPKLSEQDPDKVAGEFLETQKVNGSLTLRYWGDTFWKWQRGRYVELTKSDVRAMLVRELRREYRSIKVTDVNNILLNVSAGCAILSCHEMPRWVGGFDKIGRDWRHDEIVTTRNAIIHLPSFVDGRTPNKIMATPDLFSSIACEFDFNEGQSVPKPVRWLRFLDELFGTDHQSIELLRQWFGYCLVRDTKHHKILLAVGPPRSGKGTIARVLRSVVGDGNCCAPTLSGLATNFGLSPLIGKSLAIIGDARLSNRTDVAATTERLLSISGEDAVTIDRKHREPLTVQLKTRFMVISNELPKLNDASGALAGRLLILRFTRSFLGAEDKGLQAALDAERLGIFLWAIEGWRSLRDQGAFIKPDASEDLVEQMADMVSPVSAFLRECCAVGPGYRTSLDTLYESFRAWSETNGIEHCSTKGVFSRDLSAAEPTFRRTRSYDSGRYGKRMFVDGVALVNGSDNGWSS